jgi:outer membrane protein TolC
MIRRRMRSPIEAALYVSRFAVCAASVLVFASCLHAQLGGGAPSQTTPASQLPLSGRTAQNGSVAAVQNPVPGATASVDTLNPSVQVQGPYTGSANSTAVMPFSGKLGFREAIQRGLAYNLGAVGLAQAVRQAQGISHAARSALLPNLNGSVTESDQTENLRALGFHFTVPIPGFSIPTIVGPFNYIDARVQVTQNVLDLSAINNYRSSAEVLRSNQLSALNARDLVVLAVGGTYLQVLAAQARMASARAQLDTANAVYQQTSQQNGVGLVARIDVDRSQVQALTEQQRLVSLQNDFAKQKINLARLIGLPPTDQYELSDDIPFAAAPPLAVDEALKQAFEQRSDLKAAQAQVSAAEKTHSAARAERIPSFSFNANYGAIGTNPNQAKATYTVAGTVRVPIWQGGRAGADIEQSEAALAQRRAEAEDLKSEIESEVRGAYLDLQAATSQVDLSQRNLQVSRETLDLTRQRFEAGVTDSVEVVQSEQTLASAELDYIDSVFAHNVAKLSLARAVGSAAGSLPQFLPVR